MDISGPIREILQRHVMPRPAESIGDPLTLFVQLTAIRDHPPVGVPEFLQRPTWPLEAAIKGPQAGWVITLSAAAVVRLVPLVSHFHREGTLAILRPQFEGLVAKGEKLLVVRGTSAVEFLWVHWLLVLARERLRIAVPDMLMKGLWRRGWGGQSKEGFLHPRVTGHEEVAEVDDLRALHAAYNAVVLTRDFDKLEPLEKLVRWHAGNTRGNPPTQEPWALAPFAALDDTGYAQRQLAAATVHLATGADITTLALLADALTTQEDAAGA